MHQSTRHNAQLVGQSSAAATAVRNQAGALTRVLATFRLAPEYGEAPLIHLAHSNPRGPLRMPGESKPGARARPVRVVAVPAAPARSRGGVTSSALD
jgi:hypothetical protein